MAQIDLNTLKNWQDGDVMHAASYDNERALLITAINDNYARLIKSYKVLNPDGSVKATQNLDTAINYLQFKSDSTVTLSLDTTTSTLTIAVAPGSITGSNIASGTVTSDNIKDGTITTVDLSDKSITNVKIADGAVDLSKINTSSLDTRYDTIVDVNSKINSATATKVIQTGTIFPTTGLVDGQEFYRDDLKQLFVYDNASSTWTAIVTSGAQNVFTAKQTAPQFTATNAVTAPNIVTGFPNLLHPSRQSFSRASNAARKNLDPVPYNVLRNEQGQFGLGAFIEESTTNLVHNSDFETVTGTATVFSDPLTSYTGSSAAPWTTTVGSFTFGTGGATSGAAGSRLVAGNVNWKPLTGSNGSALSLTAQATFTTPATLPSVAGHIELRIDGNNLYRCEITPSTMWISKVVNGTTTDFTNVAQTIAASHTYTITLTLAPNGALTAKLYDGAGTGGALLQTLTATDTSLTGGFLVGVGGDTGVVISQASVAAPFADGWLIGGDQRAAWSLTTNAISGTYSLSGVGLSGVSAWVNTPKNATGTVSASAQYTLSGSISAKNAGNFHGPSIYCYTQDTNHVDISQLTAAVGSTAANFSATRLSGTGTTASNSVYFYVGVEIYDAGTFTFDAIQLEAKSYPTTYCRNDSTSSSATRQADSLSYALGSPLPSRWSAAYVFKPAYASSALPNRDFIIAQINNPSGSLRYKLLWRQSDGKIHFIKTTDGTTLNDNVSAAITFNAGDSVYVIVVDDPMNAGNTQLYVGINNGTSAQTTLANTAQITDAQVVYVGCGSTAGSEINATIDYPIITGTIPTTEQVQALYASAEWGGLRHYPGAFPAQLSIGKKGFIQSINDGAQLQLSNPNNATIISSAGDSYLLGNAYFDGSAWQRYITGRPSSYLSTNLLGALQAGTSPAGTGPITWNWANLAQVLSGGYKIQSGGSSATVATAGTSVSVTITYPVAFSSNPNVFAVATSVGSSSSTYVTILVTSASASSVTFIVNSGVAQAINFTWIAIGS